MLLAGPAGGIVTADIPRRPRRHLVQPGADGWEARQLTATPHEHQERGLKGILRIRDIGQRPTTNTPHQGPVPADEFGEIVLNSLLQEAPKQVAVGTQVSRGSRRTS